MKFTLTCRHRGDEATWDEAYEMDVVNTREEAELWGNATIRSFNETRCTGERPRELVSVKVEAATSGAKKDHDWNKTNLVTVMPKRGQSYDTYRCQACGVTARRYGVGESPVLDPKYKTRVYWRCDTTQAHLERRRKRSRVTATQGPKDGGE